MSTWQAQAEAEGLTLLVADNATGYLGVHHQPGRSKPYKAQVRRGGQMVSLCYFATAEEAALCVARSPEGQAAAKKAAAAPPLTSAEVRQQAEAEGLTLLKGDNKTGYFGVRLDKPGQPKPYAAKVSRGGKEAHLGHFATAEEAALCIARTPEGQAAATRSAAPPPPPPLTSEEVRQQADSEGLTLLKADNATGYYGVYHRPDKPKPYKAQLRRGDGVVTLGSFVTAEEAALCVARSPEGQAAAAKRAAAANPLTSEEVRQQAEAEGLTLLVADNKAGYHGVHLDQRGKPKPYLAQVWRGGKNVSLGCFPTAEEAALCVARTPEGQEAAKRAAAAPPLTSDEARQQAEVEGLTLRVADNKAGYYGVYSCYPGRPRPYQAQVWRDGKTVSLCYFATAEEAALCVARSPEGQEAATSPSAALPLTGDEARQQAEAEGLTLLKADNKAGYFNVTLDQRSKTKPYLARVTRDGKHVSLGYFATAEEAALCVARSPEGRAAAKKAAAAPLLTSEEAQQQAEAEGLTLLVANSKEAEEAAEEAAEEEEAEIVLIEAVEVVGTEAEEVEVVEVVRVVEHEGVDEGGRSEGRPKRRRSM